MSKAHFEVNSSAFNILKFGFLAGMGMTLGKWACVVIGGKLAVASAKKSLKGSTSQLCDSIIKGFSESMEQKIEKLNLDAETMATLTDVVKRLNEVDKVEEASEEKKGE